jgi:hypothetical protein
VVALTLSGLPAAPHAERSIRVAEGPIGIRFRAPATRTLEQVHLLWRRPVSDCTLAVYADTAGAPGTRLDVAAIDTDGGWTATALRAPLVAGELYHLVAQCEPGRVGRLAYVFDRGTGGLPAWQLEDLRRSFADARPMRQNPLFVLTFADGTWWGNPYRGREYPLRICGAAAVEAIIVTPHALRLHGIQLRVRSARQAALLRYRLLAEDGSAIMTGTMLSDPDLPRALLRPLARPQPVDLAAETPYRLELTSSAPSGDCVAVDGLATDLPLGPPLTGLQTVEVRTSEDGGASWGGRAASTLSAMLITEELGETCGDDRRDGDEACDGTDDGDCPGRCTIDCACAPEETTTTTSTSTTITSTTGTTTTAPTTSTTRTSTTTTTRPTRTSTTTSTTRPPRTSTTTTIRRPSTTSTTRTATTVVTTTRTPTTVAATTNPPTTRATTTVPSTTTTTTQRPPATGRTLYISPAGSDAGRDCLSASSPCRTFAWAFGKTNPNRVRAGDTVILKNASAPSCTSTTCYTDAGTGPLALVCGASNPSTNGNRCDGSGANALCGTASAPITIRAESERGAEFAMNGLNGGIFLSGCQHYVLDGLFVTMADRSDGRSTGQYRSNFHLVRSDSIVVRNSLAWRNNRYGNTHLFHTNDSSNILFERCEAYDFHRHGFDVFESDRVTVRDSYTNRRSRPNIPGGYTSEAHESVTTYASANVIIENVIVEGNGNGFGVNGGTTFNGRQAANNKHLNTIAFREGVGYVISARPADLRGPANNHYENVLAVSTGSTSAVSHAFRAKAPIDAVLRNVTLYDTKTNGGFVATFQGDAGGGSAPYCQGSSRSPALNGGRCGFDIRNSIFWSNGAGSSAGVELSATRESSAAPWDCAADYYTVGATGGAESNAAGCAFTHREGWNADPTLMGLGGKSCIVYVPAGSNMHNAGEGGTVDRGANVTCRYVNGVRQTGAENSVWRQGGCGGGVSCPADCTSRDVDGSGRPLCRGGFVGCGRVVAEVNGANGDSCFDFHERVNLKSDGAGCAVPTCDGNAAAGLTTEPAPSDPVPAQSAPATEPASAAPTPPLAAAVPQAAPTDGVPASTAPPTTVTTTTASSTLPPSSTTTTTLAARRTYRSIYADGYMGAYDRNGPTVVEWPRRMGVIQGAADAQGPLVADAKARAAAAGNGDAKFVFYTSLTSLDTKCDCSDARFYDSFVAAHPEWLLRDAQGRPASTFVPQLGAGRQLAVDVGNPAFVDAFADWALAAMEHWGWDGIYADNVARGSFTGWSAVPVNPRTGATYTTEAYRRDVLAALRQLRRRFDAEGRIVIGNHGGAWEAETFADPVIRDQVLAMHGVRVEPCAFDYDGQPQSEARWIAQLEYLHFANQAGVLTQCQGLNGALDRPGAREYLLASALLTKEGFSGIAELNRVGAWWSSLDVDLGEPRGGYECLDSGVDFVEVGDCPSPGKIYARDWTRGRVLVNPSATASVTVPLRGTFILNGKAVTSVTMRPRSGAILVRP